jgi:predicted GIY-YIG superfamily endonuclease
MPTFHYVYILISERDPDRHYVGITTDLRERLNRHNSGRCSHTSDHRPWRIETAIAFRSREKALAFERYLKTHTGRAFAKSHF